MGVLDWIVIVLYFFVMVAIGFYAKSKITNAADFFVAGGKISSPQDGMLQAWRAWAEALPPTPITSWTGRVTVLAWGDLDVVALPGEPFLAAAEYLARLRPGPVVTLGYCDGVPGYLPSCDEYPLGGYEVDDAHRYYAMPAGFARGSLERLLDVARRLLEDQPTPA